MTTTQGQYKATHAALEDRVKVLEASVAEAQAARAAAEDAMHAAADRLLSMQESAEEVCCTLLE